MANINLKHTVCEKTVDIKRSMDKLDNFVSHKKDLDLSNMIMPIVPVNECKYVINNYPTLKAVIRCLSVDTIYNEFNFNNIDGEEIDVKELLQFWKKNKTEFKKAVDNHLGYGYGACEIAFYSNDGKPAKLRQMPVETICIEIQHFNGKAYHYCNYSYENEQQKLFRITRENYDDITPEMDGSVGWCLWLGGGTESQWYDRPIWYSAKKYLFTAIAKIELDFDNISNGNIPKSALFIKGPPDNPQAGELSVYDSLRMQFRQSGGGVAIAYLETPLDSDDLRTEYVKIQDDNYDYLNNLIEMTDTVLLELYRVPKIRLMIDDNKESLNSNKSQTLYEIYSLDLESYQMPYEYEIDIFTEMFYDLNVYCSIQTPIFVDNKATQVETILNQYDLGVLRLKDALKRISELYPEHNWEEIDWEDPELAQRFYHGMLFSTPNLKTGLNGLTTANLRGDMGEAVYDTSDKQERGTGSSLNLYNQ